MLSFVSPPNTAPFVFYYKKKDCFIIYNATKSCFEIFDCGSLETRTVFEAINAENPDDVPGMMCSISEDSDDAYIIYSTWGYIASLDENHIHSYTSRFNLDDLRDEDGNPYEEIFFHQAVNPYKDHFILRSGEYTYEWIRSKDIVTLKYNTLYYNCIDFIPDIEHDRSILVHAFNGVNIFSNSEKRMYLSYRNYPLNSCVVSVAYDEHNEILALISESTTSSSEYVTLYNLLTGEQTVIFSSYYKDEMIKSVFFSTEDTLLIVTSKTCYEYDLSIGSSNKIDIYNKNEILICGTYQNNKLHVISYNPKKIRKRMVTSSLPNIQ